jgi:hypothetical protein
MKVLVGCEESQEVTKAFRALGHEAYSCDIIPCSGGCPQWHIISDVIKVIQGGFFNTQNGDLHSLFHWDMGIFFPPCTFLTCTGNKWFKPEFESRFPTRKKDRELAVDFFMKIANSPIDKIAIENPIGIMSTRFRKPDQIVHPYMFGEPERKATCLWLKGLPKLIPTNIIKPEIYTYANGKTDSIWHMKTMKLPKNQRSIERSKTFTGFAKAMAEQWTDSVDNKDNK